MHAIWVISKRELTSFFDSLIAYILLALFLGFTGFFTWILGNDVFIAGQATGLIVYSRNLILISRERKGAPPVLEIETPKG